MPKENSRHGGDICECARKHPELGGKNSKGAGKGKADVVDARETKKGGLWPPSQLIAGKDLPG
jgi:hypothetical protein